MLRREEIEGNGGAAENLYQSVPADQLIFLPKEPKIECVGMKKYNENQCTVRHDGIGIMRHRADARIRKDVRNRMAPQNEMISIKPVKDRISFMDFPYFGHFAWI